MRLDKLIEAAYQTSRKQTKFLLKSKKVQVDGTIEMRGGRNVDSRLHQIQVGDKVLLTDHVYYMLNKPQGVVTAIRDKKSTTVLDLLVSSDLRNSLYPVGRLDRNVEGLILLTDNGPLGYDLMQAKQAVPKCYEATINELITLEDVAAFRRGITFSDGTRCLPATLTILNSSEVSSQVHLVIKEGKFHQVKKMFLACGKKVVFLKRISLGPLHLDERLAVGEYRKLNQEELASLRPFFR